ncbi:hypothetical protein ACMFMG_009260 [Clarireedia jacksonii]
MAITWGTIKSLLIFFGPILLPKALSYYRRARAAPSIHGIPVRPVPAPVSRSLTILFLVALIFLLKTLPTFLPPNLFSLTSSRLQIPTDVLFNRLSTLYPGDLSPVDDVLRQKFTSLESRLLYLQFGPDVLVHCTFCSPEDPTSYFYYAIPALLTPHLFNLCVLALVTSGLFTGREGAIWRTTATTSAVGMALLDIYLTSSYAYQANSRATRLEELDFFHWKMIVYRYIGLSLLDGIIGWLLYLSSTNRAFLTPPTTAERIERTTKLLEQARGKLGAVGLVRNTVVRDKELRAVVEDYWVREGNVTREVMEDRAVVDGVRNALENRVDLVAVQREAESFAEAVVGGKVMSE